MAEEKFKGIEFDFDNDNRPMRESVADGTLFEPQYKQALRQIDSYLYELDLEKTEEDRDRSIRKQDTELISDDIDYNNNIFSFIGDRGTGKTYCMISVASMLQEKKNEVIKDYPNIAKTKFITIDLIDPAYFDNTHNLLSLFLAKLYKSYNQRSEKEKDDVSRSDKIEFLQLYREAHTQLHRLYNEKDKRTFSDEDLIEYVEEASASVKLKRTIQDLVDSYMRCFKWKDTILILRVDDVDMDLDHASRMIESMRKYFVQPNLLVFVSCDLVQLEKIKSCEFSGHLSGTENVIWAHELADRYFAKVFPHSHRIQMPEPASYHNIPLRIKGNFTTEAGLKVDGKEQEEKDGKKYRYFVSVKQAILELILKKTRYLFYNTNYYESYIVPQNLRELRQLMKLLITMPDYRANGIEHPHNRTLFKSYFYSTWVRINLKQSDRDVVSRLQSVQDISLFNKTLRGIIESRFLEDTKVSKKDPDAQKRDRFNDRFTAGDILAYIAEIEPHLIDEYDRKYLFFVKSYYSMLLYDAYCALRSELEENTRPSMRKFVGTDGAIDKPLLRKDHLSEFYDLDKLVGGSYLQLHPVSAETAVNAAQLRKLSDECIKLAKKNRLNAKDKSRILLCELLILSVYYSRPDSSTTLTNDLFDQFKKLPKEGEKQQFVVSVGALLFNLTRYKESIERFDRSFNKAITDSSSYQSIRKRIEARQGDIHNDFDWLHRVTLRNMEVMQDVFMQITDKGKKTGADQFFSELEAVATYSLPLYEHQEGGKKHNEIILTFLKPIFDGIKDARSDQSMISELFEITDSSKEINDKNAAGSDKTDVSDPATQTAAQGT